jgi:FtsP/CotA-like multicopper oxidase with cupredoxin domain
MKHLTRGAVLLSAVALSACAQAGTLGDILGGVMNAPAQTLTGTIQGVDTRAYQVFVRTSDNQTVAVSYDDRTSVVYQQQNYPVTALERGDEVTLRLTNASNNTYYTDRIDVTRSASGTGGTTSGNVQSVQGTVRQMDMTNGAFTLSTTTNGVLTVTLPYNPRSSDLDRFRNLRSGDYVRLYGIYLTNSRVELQQFY